MISILICFVLTSCEDDKKDDPKKEVITNNTSILGKWQLIKSFVNDVDDTQKCDLNDTLEYTSDNKYEDIEFIPNIPDDGKCRTEKLSGTYKVDGDKINHDNGDDIVTFSIKDNQLTTIDNENDKNILKTVYKKV